MFQFCVFSGTYFLFISVPLKIKPYKYFVLQNLNYIAGEDLNYLGTRTKLVSFISHRGQIKLSQIV
jgi:hypothetical protein